MATIVDTAGNDTIDGLGGDDIIYVLSGDDSLNELDGNYVLCGGARVDLLNGGTDADRSACADSPAGLTVDLLLPANDDAIPVCDSLDLIELCGSSLDDTLLSNDGANMIWGAADLQRR